MVGVGVRRKRSDSASLRGQQVLPGGMDAFGRRVWRQRPAVGMPTHQVGSGGEGGCHFLFLCFGAGGAKSTVCCCSTMTSDIKNVKVGALRQESCGSTGTVVFLRVRPLKAVAPRTTIILLTTAVVGGCRRRSMLFFLCVLRVLGFARIVKWRVQGYKGNWVSLSVISSVYCAAGAVRRFLAGADHHAITAPSLSLSDG